MDSSSSLLRLDGLTKCFGKFVAVHDLSFAVSGGEIVGLLGPNGAGKTTTIRCITSILQPSAGRILIGGHDIVTQTEAAKRELAYVPEVPSPYDMLTVMEHLRFVAAAYDREDEMARAEEILRRLDLWEKRHELGLNLSKGMKQKLACACAFIHCPRIYCFDEPLIGIDPKGARELKDMLAERRAAGDAVLVSTHMLDTAERLCDRVIIMHRGEVVAQGTMEELHARLAMGTGATLEDMFLRLTEEGAAGPT
ncbi:MAG: ABC transporter ATP-binding protein [Armatimonadetes bacterium]|nr:ABC transporter ATP-binding protein [Armatimonadota bacterium]